MRYVVFEAGSRAGLSALLFFCQFQKKSKTRDTLLLVDSDEYFAKTIGKRFGSNVDAVSEAEWYASLLKSNESIRETQVFPADELTRQKGTHLATEWWNRVRPEFYDKAYVNLCMEKNGISVPKTFNVSGRLIVKPNSLSAGSRGLCFFDDVCVSERIDIVHEYVVDCFYDPEANETEVHARETRLKNGYDKYIRFLPQNDKVVSFAIEILKTQPVYEMLVGPCHLQIAEDASGKLYYIEGSKRISGTSLVFLLDGYNPFFNISGFTQGKTKPRVNEWFSYEQVMQEAWRLVYG